MFKKMRKLSAVLLALVMMLALAVSAYADNSVLKVPAKNDFIDCTVVGDITSDGFTVKADVKTDVSKSINYQIQGDGLDPEFWSDPDSYVEVDLTLKTDSSTVRCILPGFDGNWKWVNPSAWDTYLKEGKTVTLREPLITYYESFKTLGINALRIQIISDAQETESVEIEVGAIRIVGADSKPVVDDTPVEDDTSSEENISDDDSASGEDDASSEDSAASEESASDDESSTTEESSSISAEESEPNKESAADEESSSASSDASDTSSDTTSSSSSASSGTSSGAGSRTHDDGGATIVVVIIIVAVVVIGGVVAGVIIYRKKKYY